MPPTQGLSLDKLYVATVDDHIQVYDSDANGGGPPGRRIGGPNTKLNGPSGVTFDAAGHLYVCNAANSVVTVYAPDADGDAIPLRTITGLGVPEGLAIDTSDNLYVLNVGGLPANRNVTVYGPGASGNAPPIREVTGIQIGNGNLNGIAIDLFDNLYISSDDNQGTISVYGFGANGPAVPKRTIRTGLVEPSDMDFDGFNNLYVADGVNVLVFPPNATSGTAPLRTIGGPHTGISNDFSIAVDQAGAVYVGNFSLQFSDNRITVYAPGASGDAAPIRTITGLPGIPSAMKIDTPKTFIPTSIVPSGVASLIGTLFGAVAVDGGGFIFIGGIPIPVGPLGESIAGHVTRDIFIGMAIEQLAASVNDHAGQIKIRGAALELVSRRVSEAIASLR